MLASATRGIGGGYVVPAVNLHPASERVQAVWQSAAKVRIRHLVSIANAADTLVLPLDSYPVRVDEGSGRLEKLAESASFFVIPRVPAAADGAQHRATFQGNVIRDTILAAFIASAQQWPSRSDDKAATSLSPPAAVLQTSKKTPAS
mmetsp:Transcript_7734/g.15110  ORF Transcript_7734/g.15110 Transcript_7734/m.15110 type:complete len:147 (+) Transcript_7734:858-1298(+)